MATEILESLNRQDRRALERMAEEAGAPAEALIAPIVGAYLSLFRDARAALPIDPVRGLSIAAAKRKGGAA